MPERAEYAPGTPSWIDIGTDVEAAKRYYAGLFGWDTQDAGPVDETGGYGFFLKNTKMVAGYGPQQNPGPPFWSTYVSVSDADETAGKVKANGGQVLMDPMDVMGAGRMAVFQDPTGAVFSAWPPGEHKGAQPVNETGTLSGNELNTRDVKTAKRFYSAVFGWNCETMEMGPMTYTEIKLGGSPIAGMTDMRNVPDEVPPHWLAYFPGPGPAPPPPQAPEPGGEGAVPPMGTPPGPL